MIVKVDMYQWMFVCTEHGLVWVRIHNRQIMSTIPGIKHSRAPRKLQPPPTRPWRNEGKIMFQSIETDASVTIAYNSSVRIIRQLWWSHQHACVLYTRIRSVKKDHHFSQVFNPCWHSRVKLLYCSIPRRWVYGAFTYVSPETTLMLINIPCNECLG